MVVKILSLAVDELDADLIEAEMKSVAEAFIFTYVSRQNFLHGFTSRVILCGS